MPPRPRASRKLLVASIGIATVSYMTATTSCGSSSGGTQPSSADATPPSDASEAVDGSADAPTSSGGDEFIVGNLAPFPVDGTAGDDGTQDAAQDAIEEFHHIVGNLAPFPIDP